MKLSLVKVGQVAGALTAIAILLAGIDSRYMTAQEAVALEADHDQVIQVVASDREKGDIDNQIEVIQLELKYLRNKENRDADDEAREEMLRAKLAVLLTRQAELRQ